MGVWLGFPAAEIKGDMCEEDKEGCHGKVVNDGASIDDALGEIREVFLE